MGEIIDTFIFALGGMAIALLIWRVCTKGSFDKYKDLNSQTMSAAEQNTQALDRNTKAVNELIRKLSASDSKMRMPRIVKTVLSPDGNRRIKFDELPDGLFQWKEEELIPPDPELGHSEWEWHQAGAVSSGYFNRLDEAEKEARLMAPWLRNA